MRALEFITGHVIYNPAHTYKFQLKTTIFFFFYSEHLKTRDAWSFAKFGGIIKIAKSDLPIYFLIGLRLHIAVQVYFRL